MLDQVAGFGIGDVLAVPGQQVVDAVVSGTPSMAARRSLDGCDSTNQA
jgi:hypothetical protein